MEIGNIHTYLSTYLPTYLPTYRQADIASFLNFPNF